MGTLQKMVELRKQLPVMTKLKAKGTAFCVEIGTAGQGISTVNLQVAVTQLVDGGIEFMDQVYDTKYFVSGFVIPWFLL